MLIATPEAIDNPFYRLAPTWALIPLTVLATAATVIASQALISGAFSLTMQASQFGYLPRMRIVHTSAQERGQVYVPAVNWLLMIACVGLVLGFRSSTNLAAAYGVAVTSTMVITTLLYYLVVRDRFGWSLPAAVVVCGAFLVMDLAFFGPISATGSPRSSCTTGSWRTPPSEPTSWLTPPATSTSRPSASWRSPPRSSCDGADRSCSATRS